MESDDDENPVANKNEEALLEKKLDEIDALPSHLRYNNFDLSCTIISILTYLFDLVSDFCILFFCICLDFVLTLILFIFV